MMAERDAERTVLTFVVWTARVAHFGAFTTLIVLYGWPAGLLGFIVGVASSVAATADLRRRDLVVEVG